MIYNFRHDGDRTEEVLARIRRYQQISQGWGGGEGGGLDLRQEDFVSRTVSHYELGTTRIPSNLSRMREFKDRDILVTPHLPKDGTVSIHIVDGDFPDCYAYDETDGTHLNHRIALECSFGLNGEISIYNEELFAWYAKLQSWRYPVVPIPQFYETFSYIVEELRSDESRHFNPSELNDFLNKCFKRIEDVLTEELRDMSASGGAVSFEGLCARLLEAEGYEIVARNQYDGQGGDVDLVCKRSRQDTSIFESGDVTLFVQIKKHEGTTNEEAVNQVIQMLEPEAHGCVMSTAEGFTAKAKDLARDYGIVLLDRHEICGLLMSLLSKRAGVMTTVETTPGVCGGAACLAGTRIPVWVLEQYRRSGASDAELLHAYPSLRAEDLVHAWAYVRSHRNEIERHIRDNEAA